MLTLPSSLRVYAAVEPVDLRKGFDALSIAVRSQLSQDPLSGSLYVFFNRRFATVHGSCMDEGRRGLAA